MTRKFNAGELNHLFKFGFDPDEFADSTSPVEYITGRAEFKGDVFKVTPDVLIPRVETEVLVDLILENISTDFVSFADVGTGSGAIGISLALRFLRRGVTYDGYLSDISPKALAVAKENAALILEAKKANCFTFDTSGCKLKIIESDLLSSYPKSKKFDFIVANLPYIPSGRLPNLEASVKDFEPSIALDGGPDGLSLINKLIEQSKDFLKPTGQLWLEVDDTHIKPPKGFEVIADQFGKPRFWRGSKTLL